MGGILPNRPGNSIPITGFPDVILKPKVNIIKVIERGDMPLYFLLGNVTENGQRRLRENPDLVVESVRDCDCEGAEILTQYAVLGRYDFVMLAEARDNDAVARLSLEMSYRVGMHIETLPAIALHLLSEPEGDNTDDEMAYAEAPEGEWRLPDPELNQGIPD